MLRGRRPISGERLGTHWHTVPQIEGGCMLGPEKPDPRHCSMEIEVKDLCNLLESEGMELPHKLGKEHLSVTTMDPKGVSSHFLAFLPS